MVEGLRIELSRLNFDRIQIVELVSILGLASYGLIWWSQYIVRYLKIYKDFADSIFLIYDFIYAMIGIGKTKLFQDFFKPLLLMIDDDDDPTNFTFTNMVLDRGIAR